MWGIAIATCTRSRSELRKVVLKVKGFNDGFLPETLLVCEGRNSYVLHISQAADQEDDKHLGSIAQALAVTWKGEGIREAEVEGTLNTEGGNLQAETDDRGRNKDVAQVKGLVRLQSIETDRPQAGGRREKVDITIFRRTRDEELIKANLYIKEVESKGAKVAIDESRRREEGSDLVVLEASINQHLAKGEVNAKAIMSTSTQSNAKVMDTVTKRRVMEWVRIRIVAKSNIDVWRMKKHQSGIAEIGTKSAA